MLAIILEYFRDIIGYLKALGSSPYLNKHILFNPNKFDASKDYKFDVYPGNIENDTWDSSEFSLRSYFTAQPSTFVAIFYHQNIYRTPDNHLGFVTSSRYNHQNNSEVLLNIMREMFENLEDTYHIGPHFKKILKDQMFVPTVQNMWEFTRMRHEVEEKYANESAELISIKELQDLTSESVNWLEIFNGQLFKRSRVDENARVWCKPNLMKELGENLMKSDKR